MGSRALALRRSAAATVGAGVVGLAYAGLVERRWYALRAVTVPVLPFTARGFLRILHLSDLHLLPDQEHKHAFVRSCLDTAPDMVVVTGDVLGHADVVDAAIDLLADVARGRTAVAVLGSNDFYGPRPKNPLGYFAQRGIRITGPTLDTPRLVAGLTAGGWQVLENRRIQVDTPAGRVDTVGLGDPHIGRDRAGLVHWNGLGESAALRLAVVHAPYRRVLDLFDRKGFDLVLAGHTHGGQLRVPGFGALVANCDLPLRQTRGLSRYGSRLWLHVSAGLGTSQYAPVRFACRPEATVLDLVPGRTDAD